MRPNLRLAFGALAASLVFGLDDDGPTHAPLNITAISSRDGYSVLQCWQLASIPIDAMQAANYPVGNTTVATWSRIEPETHVGEAWAPHVQLSVILSGLIRITSPAPAAAKDPSTGMYMQKTEGREGTMMHCSRELNESMLIMPEQPQLPTVVEAPTTNDHDKEEANKSNNLKKRPETQVAYIMPGTLKSSVVIAADLKSVSNIAGHYTEFPSNTEPTILVQIPFEGDKAPEHTVLHDGPHIFQVRYSISAPTRLEQPTSCHGSGPWDDKILHCVHDVRIDFREVFSPTARASLPVQGRVVCKLGRLSPGTSCVACRLFYDVAAMNDFVSSSDPKVDAQELRLFMAAAQVPTFQGDGKSTSGPNVHVPSPVLVLGVFEDVPPNPHCPTFPTTDWYLQQQKTAKGFIVPRFSDRPAAAYCDSQPLRQFLRQASSVNLERVNYARLKEWLTTCDMRHGPACKWDKDWESTSSMMSAPLRCVDCSTRQIVRLHVPVDHPTRPCKYFALSYVWGASHHDSTDAKGAARETNLPSLPTRGVPAVVEDAITVVLELGERYLWVDKYCIDQESHDVKNGQLLEMDKVYAGAYATIIASAGADASYGLPGVGAARPRVNHYPPVITPWAALELHPPLPSREHAVESSVWSTRGWTYQEAYLSRRCLYFTDHQVYFVCPDTESIEAVLHEDKQDTILPSLLHRKEEETWNISLLTHHIEGYSRRGLTYEEDRLNAFRGLLSRSGFYSYYGVPFYTPPFQGSDTPETSRDFDSEFARGLVWQWQQPTSRPLFTNAVVLLREPWRGFPRWSWVSSGGHVNYGQIFGPPNARFKCDVRFLVEGNPDSRHDGNVLFFDFKTLAASSLEKYNTRLLPELSPFLVFKAKVYQFLFQEFSPDRYGVCLCHPKSRHRRGIKEPQILGYPQFDVSERFPGYIRTRLRNNALWDCVLLYEASWETCRRPRRQERRHYLLVGDWVDQVAYRVGTLAFSAHDKTLKKLPWVRKRIRLG